MIRGEAMMEDKSSLETLRRFMHKHRIESEAEDKQKYIEEQTALKALRFNQQETLARELDKVKQDEIVDKKYRQQLRETSHELKELEKKLQTGYIRKELIAQIAEKEAFRKFEKMKERQEFEVLTKAIETEKESLMAKAAENLQKTTQYRMELQNQMIYEEQMKRFKYEEFLREKKMIDDIVIRIYEEDERNRIDKMCKIKKTKEEMMAFKEAQDVLKRKKAEEIEAENRKIHDYVMSRSSNLSEIQKEKVKREEQKRKIIERMLEEMYYDLASKREREEIIQELLLQEKEQQIDAKHRKEVEKAIRQKIEMRQSLVAQIQDKQERRKKDAAEDAAFREQVTAKLMEDNRLELLSNEKRRLKMVQIRKEVQQMMVDKRLKHAEELQREKISREQEEKEDDRRNRIIEEERINMLKQHCGSLIGYLPKGVLRPEDLDVLGTGVLG